MDQLQKNIRLYYVSNFTSYLQFIMPIYLLFGTQYLGLSYTQAASFLLVNNLTTIVFDFFLGIFAIHLVVKKVLLLG